MALDSIITSPHRRSHNTGFSSPTFRQQLKRDELGSWSVVFQRHRFLLTTLVLLAFLCFVYLYFAITLGAEGSCNGLTGAEKASCRLAKGKSSISKGKLNFL